jgi:hypothetical protein
MLCIQLAILRVRCGAGDISSFEPVGSRTIARGLIISSIFSFLGFPGLYAHLGCVLGNRAVGPVPSWYCCHGARGSKVERITNSKECLFDQVVLVCPLLIVRTLFAFVDAWLFCLPGGRYVRSLASNVLDFKICLIRLWKPCFCFRLMEFGRILLFPVSVFLCSSFVVFFCMISLCINCEVYPLVRRIFFFYHFSFAFSWDLIWISLQLTGGQVGLH